MGGSWVRSIALRHVDGRTLAVAMAILVFNLVDAFATLRHLSHGAEELNPLMDAALRRGAGTFLFVKHGLASLGVIGIVVHRELPAARLALRVLLPVYFLLAVYQVALFAIIP